MPRAGTRPRGAWPRIVVISDAPPIRLAHVLFILWVAGSVAWAFHSAMVAYNQGWWELRPELGAALVLTPLVLAHLLAIFVIRITGNPKLR